MPNMNQIEIPQSFMALFVAAGRLKPSASLELVAGRYELCEDMACTQIPRVKFPQPEGGDFLALWTRKVTARESDERAREHTRGDCHAEWVIGQALGEALRAHRCAPRRWRGWTCRGYGDIACARVKLLVRIERNRSTAAAATFNTQAPA